MTDNYEIKRTKNSAFFYRRLNLQSSFSFVQELSACCFSQLISPLSGYIIAMEKLHNMLIKSKSKSTYRERNGLISHILLQQGDVPNDNLSITWVDIIPGSEQKPHKHLPEQAYIIIKGRGQMQIGDKSCDVSEGDLIYIPSNEEHSIKNTLNENLSYISASTPAFDLKVLYDKGTLKS